MESMGKKKPRPRRSFVPELKAEIVELCRRGDRSVGQVAEDFDLTETTVRDRVKQPCRCTPWGSRPLTAVGGQGPVGTGHAEAVGFDGTEHVLAALGEARGAPDG